MESTLVSSVEVETYNSRLQDSASIVLTETRMSISGKDKMAGPYSPRVSQIAWELINRVCRGGDTTKSEAVQTGSMLVLDDINCIRKRNNR